MQISKNDFSNAPITSSIKHNLLIETSLDVKDPNKLSIPNRVHVLVLKK